MPPKDKAAATANGLNWTPASDSTPGNLRFISKEDPDFKAAMATTSETPGVLLVVNSALPSVAGQPEHRRMYPDFAAAQAAAERLHTDWQADYARDPGPGRTGNASPTTPFEHPSQEDILAQLNAGATA